MSTHNITSDRTSANATRPVVWTAALGIAVIVGTIWFLNRDDAIRTLNAPYDTAIEVALKEARSLRKSGYEEEAFRILSTQAARRYAPALHQLGLAHSRGWGTAVDLDAARDAFLQAVEYDFPGRGETAYELGRLYQRSVGEDCNALAVSWFQRAEAWGYTKAHLQLAVHYERGLGIDRDIDRAFHHYEVAAAHGSEAAAIKFARALKRGAAGLAADPDRAAYLADIAIRSLVQKARAGSGSAAKLLGRLYRDGDFVVMDLTSARRWFQRSGELGDPGGMHDLARLVLATETDPVQHRRALAWLRRAVSLGHGGAMTAIGRFHLAEKYGLNRNDAVIWFERGVEALHAGAMEELARLYAAGDLVTRDMTRALDLAERGAELGHRGSQTLLTDLRLRRGSVTGKDQKSDQHKSSVAAPASLPQLEVEL